MSNKDSSGVIQGKRVVASSFVISGLNVDPIAGRNMRSLPVDVFVVACQLTLPVRTAQQS
jgi:hypothetical protein